jgi:hypothetical protein
MPVMLVALGASLSASPQPLFCWLAGSMKNNKVTIQQPRLPVLLS